MYDGHDQAIAALLRAANLLPPETVATLCAEGCGSGRSLAQIVVEDGFIGRDEFLRCVAEHLGVDYVGEPPAVTPELRKLISPDLARRYGVVPFGGDAGVADLLVLDPFRVGMAGELAFALRRDVRLAVADPDLILELLRRHYGQTEPPAATSLIVAEETDAGGPAADDLARMAGQTAAVSFVDAVLSQAIRAQASDVHFEPFENAFKVRCRVDGTLQDMAPPPPQLALPVISRLKVLAGLNIAERRVPQDGRMRFPVDGRSVDLRISTLPTQSGESVVLRVLDQSCAPLELARLGLPAALETGLREVIGRPSGIVLVTGPTGSGKTTTLYSCLRLINRPGRKILTAEDPVEYEIEGVMQLGVNPAIGLTFASALRSFLRQDPDVLMVGEIRDLETAQIALQAALTGHLVLSTLHTNDAAGAVTRLIDMGVEPYLLSATLEAVLAQRLLRCVCPACREKFEPDGALLAALELPFAEIAGAQWCRGRGCTACQHTGYHGRTGIFEWLRMNDPLRELVLQRAPAQAIKQAAMARGMQTLRADGQRVACEGRTTLEELARYV